MTALMNFLGDEIVIGYGALFFLAMTCLAYVSLYYWKNREGFDWKDVIVWSIHGGILLCLVVPMVLRLGFTSVWFQYLTQTRRLSEHLSFLPWLAGYFLLWAGGSFLLARKKISHLVFLLLFFLPLFFLLRFLFLYYVDGKPYSDFQTYWLIAQENVKAGKILARVQTESFTAGLTYCRRAAVIWTPLVWLFGPEPVVYKTANVVMQCFTFLMAYRIAVRHFGKTAAQLSVWFILFIPELILSCGVPTHDLNAMFLLFGYFFLIDASVAGVQKKKLLVPMLLACLAGLLWLAVDLQRSYGPFILWSTFFFSGAIVASQLPNFLETEKRKEVSKEIAIFLLVVLVLPWSVHTVSEHYLLQATGLKGTLATGGEKVYHTSLDNWDGRYNSLQATKNFFTTAKKSARDGLPKNYWNRYYRNIFLSGYLHNQLRYIPQLMNRTNGLLWLGRDISFYFSHLQEGSHIAPRYKALRGLYFISDVYLLFFLLVGVGGLAWSLKNRLWNLYSYLPIFFLSLMIALLILFGEIQARYSYPIWVILPLFLGSALHHWLSGKKKESLPAGRLLWGLAIVVGCSCFGFLGIMSVYAQSSEKLINMKSWTVFTSEAHSPEDYYEALRLPDGTIHIAPEQQWKPEPGRKHSNNNLRLELLLPKQPTKNMYTAARRIFSLKPGMSYTLQGILESGSQNVLASVEPGDFFLTVWCNGEMMYAIDYKKIQWLRYVRIPGFTATDQGEAEIQFRIIANRDYGQEDWKTVSTIGLSHFQLVPSEGD